MSDTVPFSRIILASVAGGIAARIGQRILPNYRWPLDFIHDYDLQQWISLGNYSTNAFLSGVLGGLVASLLFKRFGAWIFSLFAASIYLLCNLISPVHY